MDASPGTGGSGSEANHSLGLPTGYSDREVYDLEGPEAGAPGDTNHSIDHYNNLGNGSAPVTGLPVILNLDGDGVEGNAANGGWAREAPRLAA